MLNVIRLLRILRIIMILTKQDLGVPVAPIPYPSEESLLYTISSAFCVKRMVLLERLGTDQEKYVTRVCFFTCMGLKFPGDQLCQP